MASQEDPYIALTRSVRPCSFLRLSQLPLLASSVSSTTKLLRIKKPISNSTVNSLKPSFEERCWVSYGRLWGCRRWQYSKRLWGKREQRRHLLSAQRLALKLTAGRSWWCRFLRKGRRSGNLVEITWAFVPANASPNIGSCNSNTNYKAQKSFFVVINNHF